MQRRAFLATVGSSTAGLAVGLSGCLGVGGSPPEYDIGMSSSRFRPQSFEVAPGATVRWLNTSSHAHTVTAYESGLPDDAAFFASGGFESTEAARRAWDDRSGGRLVEGDTFEHTFEVPGTHNYFCIPHERNGMVGEIVVTEDAMRTPR
jgi:plastocyanin